MNMQRIYNVSRVTLKYCPLCKSETVHKQIEVTTITPVGELVSHMEKCMNCKHENKYFP